MRPEEGVEGPGDAGATHAGWRRWMAPLLAVALLVGAFVVLQKELGAHALAEVMEELQALSPYRVGLALLFTAASYAILTSYDALALRYVTADVPYRQAAFASFLGYAFSNALGFPLLTGAPIRYRLYASWGVEAGAFARIVAFYSGTFWLGFVVVGGMAFSLEPLPLPGTGHGLTTLPLGVLLLILAGGYLVAAARVRRPLRLGRWSVTLPRPGLAVKQVLAGLADWTVAAAVLYVLLPSDHGLSFPLFLSAFLLAQIVGFISHVPGGLGVFEAVLLVVLPDRVADDALVASLLVYRAVYYLLPLLLATLMLGVYELWVRRGVVGRTMGRVGEGVSGVVPLALSAAVFIAGALLLVTGSLPLPAARLSWLAEAVPLPVLEVSHFLGSVVGAGLLVLAWGLARRLDGAYHLTLMLLGVGLVLTVTRGGIGISALTQLLVLTALLPSHREFFRSSSLTAEPFSPGWAMGIVATLLAALWIGFFAFRNVGYTHDVWWRFAASADAPRFLRGAVGASLVLLLFGATRLLRPSVPPEAEPRGVIPDAVVELVARSPRSYANLALLGDKAFFLDPGRRGFVMFGVEGRSWVSMGDPVGEDGALPDLVWEFRSMALRHGGWPVFYQAHPRHLGLYADAGLRLLKLGEEALVPLAEFGLEGGSRSGLRRTVRKVEQEGGRFSVLPATEVGPHLPVLREISDAWLADKGAREKAFSLGAFSEDYLRRLPVALVSVEERPVAFANLFPAAPGQELSVDLMRYDPATAPRSCMEYMFVQLMLWGRQQGYATFNLGMAPLSGLEDRPMAPRWDRLGAAVFRYGEHFYNFQGLRAYKEKFDPHWEGRYLAAPGGLALPTVLTNISTLVAGGLRAALLP